MLRDIVIQSRKRIIESVQQLSQSSLFFKDTEPKTLYELITTTDDGLSFIQKINDKTLNKELRNIYHKEFTTDIISDCPMEMLLCFFSNTLLPQVERKEYDKGHVEYNIKANPLGTVSRGEFFDSINAIVVGANSIYDRTISVDGMVFEYDYFNMGYNLFCRDKDSVLYRKLHRADLIQPITWLEVVYYLTFEYLPIRQALNIIHPKYYDFSRYLKEDIHSAEYAGIKLSVKCDSEGFIDYNILETPIKEYMSPILNKTYALPYIFWFSYQRLKEINIVNISSDSLFKYISREQVCVLLLAITELVTIERSLD